MNLSKRVIILDKLNSPNIAQAIFILKDDSECEFSAVVEAEKIVQDYINNSYCLSRRKIPMPIILSALGAIGIVLAVIFSL